MEYKGYKIEGDGTFGMKVIKVIGFGGGLPKVLEGSYTKAILAIQAIDQYLLQRQEKDDRPPPIKKVKLFPREVKTDGTESESRD
jgi:hypothetical protein